MELLGPTLTSLTLQNNIYVEGWNQTVTLGLMDDIVSRLPKLTKLFYGGNLATREFLGTRCAQLQYLRIDCSWLTSEEPAVVLSALTNAKTHLPNMRRMIVRPYEIYESFKWWSGQDIQKCLEVARSEGISLYIDARRHEELHGWTRKGDNEISLHARDGNENADDDDYDWWN